MTTDLTSIDRLWHDAFDELQKAPAAAAERRLLDAFVQGHIVGCLELRQHCGRVADFAVRIGEEIGLSLDKLNRLGLAALLHDCGKVSLDPCVLDKPVGLSCDERMYVQTHALRGAKMLGKIKPLADLVPDVMHHHERFDGNGYPKGLPGAEIPLGARIISIADSFDAMTSPRTYSDPLDCYQAFGILFAECGSQFDPELVDAFASRHEEGASIRALCLG
jgi:HD-GYP domain-containing protein (c-di-GMP phosphodiesterase class II)